MREYRITKREALGDPDPVTLTLYSLKAVREYIADQRRVAFAWEMPAPVFSVLSAPGR